MCTIEEIICLVIMVFIAIKDIKTREVSVLVLVAAGVAGISYHLIAQELDWWLIIAGAIVGGCFLIIGKITKEKIGYGDGLVISLLGLFVGFWNILVILSITFFLLLCVSIPVMCKKKMSKNYTLPFLPFLAGGYFCFLIMGGSGI